MTTLLVAQSTDYSGQVFNPAIDVIEFTNTLQGGVTLAQATFLGNQFGGGGQISLTVNIVGTNAANRIVINGTTNLDAGGWTFSNWSGNDSISINCGNGINHTVRGSSQNDGISGGDMDDVIQGRGGADKLIGRGGNDTFEYGAGHLAAGEVINGGAGFDTISIFQGAVYDFSVASIVSVGTLGLVGGTEATFSSQQVGGTGGISFVTAFGSDFHSLFVNGSNTNLSAVVFSNWDPGNGDLIAITGTDGSDTLTGSTEDDNISGGLLNDVLIGLQGEDVLYGGGGADSMTGGANDDTFIFLAGSDVVAGEVVNGGGGLVDAIHLLGGGQQFNLSLIDIISVERLEFPSFASARLDASQIGSAAGKINSVHGGGDDNDLRIEGLLVDLTGVTFTNWSSEASVTIDVPDGSSDVKGSTQSDLVLLRDGLASIQTRGGNDTIRVLGSSSTGNFLDAGSVLDGGGGTQDVIAISGFGIDLSACQITGFEILRVSGSPVSSFSGVIGGSQIGVPGGIQALDFEAFLNVGDLTVIGNVVELSTVTFVTPVVGNHIKINGTSAADTLGGSSQSDTLSGLAGADILRGRGGEDVLIGGGGKDTLTGGQAADTFVLANVNHSAVGAARDVITDFAVSLDVIDLSLIDAKKNSSGNDEFDFIGSTKFSGGGVEGELRAVKNAATNITIVSGDIDGDGVADFQIELSGLKTLSDANFIL